MRLRSLALVAALLVPGTLAAATLLHTALSKSAPAANEVVTSAPKEVRLWFTAKPELALTSIVLTKADNTPVAKLTMAATDDSLSVKGTIPLALAPGGYVAVWKTASPDGHVVRGKIPFTYAPAGSAKP